MAKKSVLISGSYVHSNVGDRVLRDAAVHQVRVAHPGCEIVISGMDDPKEHSEFEGVRNLGSMRHWASRAPTRTGRLVRRSLVSGIGLLWNRGPNWWYRRAEQFLPTEVGDELAAIRSADHVVSLVGAGPYIQGASKPGLGKGLDILVQLSHVAVAKRAGVEVTLTPQSYGPFPGGWRKRFIRETLNGTNVLVREDESMRRLEELQLEQPGPSRAVDLAFTLPPRGRSTGSGNWRERHRLSDDEVLIGLTVRKCLPTEKQTQFEHELAKFIDAVQAMPNHRLVLFPTTTNVEGRDDDRLVQRCILDKCNNASDVVVLEADDVDPRAVAAELDFLVGNRFHSVIFALIERVPSIGLAYEQKTRGILADLGLDNWVIKVDDMSADVLAHELQLLEQDKERFLAKLEKALPLYMGRNELAQAVADYSEYANATRRQPGHPMVNAYPVVAAPSRFKS